MAYTNIKTEIDGKIYTNILREITGDILNEVLKKMVDSLGKGYRYMGILEPDDSRPSGDENMFMIATEAGYYTALANDVPSGITICSFSESSIQVETILNLDDIFSGNHSWGGSNTFNGFTQFQNEVDVSFENVYDLEDGETLSGKLASLVTAIATKISKVTGAEENNLATFDENGNVKDGGVSLADIDEKIEECAKPTGIYEKMVAGSAHGILSPSAIEELFLFQRTANGAGGTGAAIFQSIKGNSIVWNQLVQQTEAKSFTGSSGTFVRRNEFGTFPVIQGHKYYCTIFGTNAPGFYGLVLGASPYTALTNAHPGVQSFIDTANASVTATVQTLEVAGTAYSNVYARVIDLTAGNMENWTLAQIKALYPDYPYAPNPGAIRNNCATGMVTDGFNQWDEEWELGEYNTSTGEKQSGSSTIRCKNLIPVVPNTTYYCVAGSTSSTAGAIAMFYDGSGTLITGIDRGNNYIAIAGTTFTTPANAAKMSFYTVGTTYNHDICINISGSRNGQYEPHWSDTTALPITTATGKLNGEGESVVISPNGLAGVGSSYDEGIVEKGMWTKTKIRRARIDLGTLEWSAGSVAGLFLAQISGQKVVTTGIKPNDICSKYDVGATIAYSTDAADKTIYQGNSNNYIYFKDTAFSGYTPEQVATALAGEELEYELATEQLYVLDTPVPVVARVDENGTQTILPQGVDESGVPMTAPFKASIQYPVKLGIAPIGQQSLVNLLEKMKSAGKIASYTMFWDAATGAYDFTIS